MSKSLLRTFNQLKKGVTVRVNELISASFSRKYLFYTNIGISFVLSSLGDCIEQNYELYHGDLDAYDYHRTQNMSMYGIMVGAFCHHWYNFLDAYLPGYTLRTVLKKIFMDQFVCSPVCITTLFITTGLMERKTLDEIWEDFRTKGVILYKAEWVVWPPAQFFSFYFLSTKYRVLYDNTISLGYDIYTSNIKHAPKKKTVADSE